MEIVQRTLKIHAHAAPWWDGVEIAITARVELSDSRAYVHDLCFREIDPPTGQVTEPALVLTMENAQQLMNDLWASGIRPSESLSPGGALQAMREHMKDLQRLVFLNK